MLSKTNIFVLVGVLASIQLATTADIITAYNDIDFQVDGARYPRWSVDVYRNQNQEYRQICGGSVVAPRVVISAARCFWNASRLPPASQFVVARTFGGALNGRSFDKLDKSNVSTYYIPYNYRGYAGLYANDIAVVILQQPFRSPNVIPICVNFGIELDRQQLREGIYGRNLGTLQGAEGLPSPLFTTLEVPFVSIQRCINGSEPYYREQITSDKICTGFKPGPSGAPESLICREDHGSGLAMYSGSANYAIPYLRGVATTPFPEINGTTYSGCSTFPFATFTRIAAQQDFLRSVVPGLEAVCAQYYQTPTSQCICNCN